MITCFWIRNTKNSSILVKVKTKILASALKPPSTPHFCVHMSDLQRHLTRQTGHVFGPLRDKGRPGVPWCWIQSHTHMT